MEGNDKGYEKMQENYTTGGGGKVGAVKREKTKRVIRGKEAENSVVGREGVMSKMKSDHNNK